MTPEEEKAAITETLAFAKSKGLSITWTNEWIVVIHASKKTLKTSQQTNPGQDTASAEA